MIHMRGNMKGTGINDTERIYRPKYSNSNNFTPLQAVRKLSATRQRGCREPRSVGGPTAEARLPRRAHRIDRPESSKFNV